MKKILLCLDGSEHALNTVKAAATLAKKLDGALTILHVFTMPVYPAYLARSLEAAFSLLMASKQKVQDAVLRSTGCVLEEAGVAYTVRHEVGDPAEVIVLIAEEEQFDLIVLGSRGLSKFKSPPLGSVADRVSNQAHCSVLIVR